MKHTFFRRLGALLMALALSLTLVVPAWAADGDSSALTVQLTGETQLKVGEEATLQVAVTENLAADEIPQFHWASSDTDVISFFDASSANIPEKKFTPKKAGTATITVTVKTHNQPVGNPDIPILRTGTASIDVTVTDVTVTGVTIHQGGSGDVEAKTLELKTGETADLFAAVEPPNATNKTVTWSVTGDAGVIALDKTTGESVKVTAKGVGEATITAAAGGESAACKVTVEAKSVNSVTILGGYNDGSSKEEEYKPLILDPGSSQKMTASVDPETATDKDVTWSIGDTNVAHISADGTVSALNPGKTTITATAGGVSATCSLEVSGGVLYQQDSDIPLTEVTLLLGGKNYTPRLQAFGNALAKQGDAVLRIWQSDDPLVAAVNRTVGTITPRGVGEAHITFTYTVGGKEYEIDPIKVTVIEDDDSILRENATAGAPYLFSDIMPELNSICRNLNGGSNLVYITNVQVPTKEGVLYYNHVSSDDTGFGVGATEQYYYDENAVGHRYLSGLTFVPASDFNGETTITFTGYAANKKTYSGKIRLTVTGTGNVTFITRAGQPLVFSSSNFSAACRSETGREVDRVAFTLPGEDKGLFCYGYASGKYQYEMTEGDEYFRLRVPYLDQVAFLPAEYYIGTFSLPFSGHDTSGVPFNGKLYIIVAPNSPDGEHKSLTTTALRGTTVDFDKFDFNAACQSALGQSLSYVRFTPPSSSVGTLYYKYTSSGSYDSLVNAITRYRLSSTPKLDDLTFVPVTGQIAPVTIDFVGYSTSGNSFNGTVTIYYRDADSVGDVITYAVSSGQAIPFEQADFDALCENVTGKTLSRIEFPYLPDSWEGTLYRNYNTGSSVGTKITTKDKIYRSSLSGVAFAPRSDYVGTVELEFNGYATDGTHFTGTVRIEVEEGNTTLYYSVLSGASVYLRGDDFNTICKQATDGKLNYVRFQLPKATEGKLYYRYSTTSTSKSSVSSSSKYYYSTSGSNKLDNVLFTAASNYTGVVSIDYTGFSTSGAQFTGTVEINVSYHNSTTLSYSATSVPFSFPAQDVFSACSPLLDQDLSYVLINSLPKTDEGKLYYDYIGYNTGSEAKTTTKYYRNKASYLNRLVFIPKAGFTGTVTLPYTAFDTKGDAVSGEVIIKVSSTASTSFTDLGTYAWAIPSVNYLYASGVVVGDGSSRFHPTDDIKRGDFVLLLHLIYNLKAAGKTSFSDVPEDIYYAEAVAAAKAAKVITGEDGLFHPEEPITRQDAMLFLRNAMKAAGKSVPAGSASELYAFADYNSVSSQARSAVISMIHMGIVSGDNFGRLNPTKPISRAEIATLMHRVMTL